MLWERRIERTPDGDFSLRLSPEERELLRALPAELRALLDADSGASALHRLFPPAYGEDPESEAEYRRLMRDELLEGRRAALVTLEETLDRERLSESELHAWLGALNDLRLVLGTRLEVTEETYERELSPSDPQARELALFGYLTWLQEEAVGALEG